MKYLFFDTETTGLPKNWRAPITQVDNWPRVVQLAWLLTDANATEISSGNYIIKPEGFRIPIAAAKVHGISTEKALEEGKDLKLVLQSFEQAVQEADFLVAHNISFDYKVTAAELIRTAIDGQAFHTISQICTKEESTDYCQLPGRYGYKWPTLTELHTKLFGADFEDAHDALVDVKACARCFFELVDRKVIIG